MGNKYSEAYLDIKCELSKDKISFYTKPKVVIAGMTKVLESVYVESDLGLGVGIYAIHDLENEEGFFLSAILNSKFINDYFTEMFKDKALAGGYLAINKNTIEKIPYIEPNEEMKIDLIKVSKKIHLQKQENPKADTAALESEIDQMVYKLYGLSLEEITIIENS